MTVIDRDLGYRALIRRLGRLNAVSLTVGIHADDGGDEHGGGGASVAEVAAFHEFGTATIPSRSFIGGGIDAHERELRELIKRSARRVVSNRRRLPATEAARVIGARAVALIQQRMRAGIDPPLVARAGVPLIDTGQLIASIRFKVR